MRKANLMFFGSHLPLAIFKSHTEGYIQAYYPRLSAAAGRPHALHGGVETSTVHDVVWILLLAFVWAGGFLASRVTRPLVWATLLAWHRVPRLPAGEPGYADIPVAIFLCLGVLATGIWLERRRRADLWVACLLLAGAVQIKNEGFIGAIIILVVAACYLLRWRQWAAIRELAVGAAGVVLVAILPWRLWLVANHIPAITRSGETSTRSIWSTISVVSGLAEGAGNPDHQSGQYVEIDRHRAGTRAAAASRPRTPPAVELLSGGRASVLPQPARGILDESIYRKASCRSTSRRPCLGSSPAALASSVSGRSCISRRRARRSAPQAPVDSSLASPRPRPTS